MSKIDTIIFGKNYDTDEYHPLGTDNTGNILVSYKNLWLSNLDDTNTSGITGNNVLVLNNKIWYATSNIGGDTSISGNVNILGNMTANTMILNTYNIATGNLSVSNTISTANLFISKVLSTPSQITSTNSTILSKLNTNNLEISNVDSNVYITNMANNGAHRFYSNIGGTLTLSANISTAGLYMPNMLYFGADELNYMESPSGGNLDIKSINSNVIISANTDVIIKSNIESSIKLLGPSDAIFATFTSNNSNVYLGIGTVGGESDLGIKYATGNVYFKNTSGQWSDYSNTYIGVGTAQLALGNTVPGINISTSTNYKTSNLSGQITNGQMANSNIVVGNNTIILGSIYPGLDLYGFSDYNASNLVGQATISQLANSNVKINTSTLVLGTNYPGIDVSGCNGYSATNLVGTVTNGQLTNTSVTLASRTYTLGSASTILNITDMDYASVNTSNGAVLKWNNSTNLWNRRSPDYYHLIISGKLAAIANTTTRYISSPSTSSVTPPAAYSTVSYSNIGNVLTWSSTDAYGGIRGLDPNKYYRVSASFNIGISNISDSTCLWRIYLYTNNNTAAGYTQQNQAIDDYGANVDYNFVITNNTVVNLGLSLTAGSYSLAAQQNVNCSFIVYEL